MNLIHSAHPPKKGGGVCCALKALILAREECCLSCGAPCDGKPAEVACGSSCSVKVDRDCISDFLHVFR
jgi:hypothetical protein